MGGGGGGVGWGECQRINPHWRSEGRRQGSGAVFLGEMESVGKYINFFAKTVHFLCTRQNIVDFC